MYKIYVDELIWGDFSVLPQTVGYQTRVILCCYRAFNVFYYKYTVQGINIFALSILFHVVGLTYISYKEVLLL